MKRRLFRDLCLIAVILLVCVAALFLLSHREEGAWAVVQLDGVEVARFDLNRDGEYILNGGSNTLRIENHQACVCWADCPDKLCVNQGRIHGSGQMIVCLPNKLTVTIEGVKAEIDLIS